MCIRDRYRSDMSRLCFVSCNHLIMLWKGVMPMPPATKVKGILASIGNTKSPIGSLIVTVSPVFDPSRAFLNELLGLENLVVMLISGASLGLEETVNQRFIPRSSGLSCLIVISIYCPAI